MLIFVHSRKETYKTAKFLQEEAMRNDDLAKFMPQNAASREILQVSVGALCRRNAGTGLKARVLSRATEHFSFISHHVFSGAAADSRQVTCCRRGPAMLIRALLCCG